MSIEPLELFYKEYGEGPPLVILHGLLGAGGNWHTLSRNVFAEAYTVYAVDLRNHGRSPHAHRFDYPSMVVDLERFFQDHGLTEAALLGHSMGGKVAMHFALSNPERVARLVVVDIAAKAYPPSHASILEALETVDFPVVEGRDDVDEQLASRIDSAAIRQFLMKNLAYDSETDRYSWQMALEAIRSNYDQINLIVENGRTYNGPTLFVRGEHSDYIDEDDMEPIRRLFPNARLESVEEAGHWVHADAPDAFADVVLGFLRKPA